MTNPRPDATDERILRLLVQNARATWREIGDEVGLSANAVAQRVRRLEDHGWVRGYTAVLDPGLANGAQQAVVLLRMAIDVDTDDVEARLHAMPNVTEVLDVAGPVDYYVRVRYRDPDELNTVIGALRALPSVTNLETRIVLRNVLSR